MKGHRLRAVSEEAEEQLSPPGRAAAGRAASFFTLSAAAAFQVSRQDGVVDASSGVVHGYLEASQDQKQSETKRVSRC